MMKMCFALALTAAAALSSAAPSTECQMAMAKLETEVSVPYTAVQADAEAFVQSNTASCAAEFAKHGNCTRDVDWRYKEGDVNALKDAVSKADDKAQVCQLDMMGENTVGLTKVRYAWQHATYGYVAGNCSAEDVTKLTYALAAQYQKAYAPFGCTELVLAVSDPHKCKWPQ